MILRYFLLLTAISIISFSTNAFAWSTDYGKNYIDQVISVDPHGNAIHQLTTHADRLPDGAGHYATPYFVFDNGNSYTIATGIGTYVYTSSGIKFYQPTQNPTYINSIINSISFTIKYTDNLNGTWTDFPINNQIPITSKTDDGSQLNLISSRNDAQGSWDINYKLQSDRPMEYISTFTYQDTIPHYIILTETQDGIPANITLHNDNGTILQNGTAYFGDTAKEIHTFFYSNGGYYSYGNSLSNLYKVEYHIHSDGTQQIVSSFVSSSPLNQGEKFMIDPTFGYSTGLEATVFTSAAVSATCPAIAGGGNDTVSNIIFAQDATAAGRCDVIWDKFVISSIPASSIVISTTVKMDVATPYTNKGNCDFVQLTAHDLQASSFSTAWSDVTTGTAYVSNDSICQTAAVAVTKTLGSTANTDVQNQRNTGKNWYQVGFRLTDWNSRAATGNTGAALTNIQLQIVYQPLVYTKVTTYKSDGSTKVYPANIIASNSTKSGTIAVNTTSNALLPVAGNTNQNFTVKDTNINFVTYKQYNYNSTGSNSTLNFSTHDFLVDCPSTGTGNDIELWTNDTDGHRISSFPSPTCFANNTVKSHPYFLANGKSSVSYSTIVKVRVINGTFMMNPTLKSNSTLVTTSLSTPYITSNSITVGTGLQSIGLYLSMNLTTATPASAPNNLVAVPTSTSNINLTWSNPTTNGTYPITGFKILRNGTTLVNDTGAVHAYSDGGLSSGHQETYKICAWSIPGCGAYSSPVSAITWEGVSGVTVLVNKTIVGDVIKVQPYLVYQHGSPAPTITQEKLYNKTVLRFTNSTLIFPTSGRGIHVYGMGMYDPYLGESNSSNYTMSIMLTNSVGSVNVTSSNATGMVRNQYTPQYINAIDTTQGLVNYTYVNGTFQVTRHNTPTGNVWKIECLYKDWGATILNSTTGTWDNHTIVGYYQYPIKPVTNTYTSCWNDGLLFSGALIEGNSSNYIIPGLIIFDQLGGFLGAPSVLIFILAILSWGTGRNFPMVITIAISALGIMGALGLLVLHAQIWALLFVIGGLAIFGIRKFY